MIFYSLNYAENILKILTSYSKNIIYKSFHYDIKI